MKAIQFVNTRDAQLVDIDPVDVPAPDEVLVRTHRMGICGTDVSAFLGRFPFFQFPRIPGHELGVEVTAVGSEVDGIAVGDRCAIEPYFNNPESRTSQRGLTNCCPDLQVLGVHCDGGLRTAPYAVPARRLHIGNDLSFDELSLVEPLAIGYHAVERGAPQAGETVLVIGAGPIGLACLEFLKLHDVRVIVIDLDPGRLEFCRSQLGIADTLAADPDGRHLQEVESLTGGHLADLVIDATGSARSMSTCFEFAGFGGRVVYVGVAADDLQFQHAPIFHRRELTLMASRNARSHDFGTIIQILNNKEIDLGPWMTHRLAISEVPSRFAEVTHPDAGAIKAIIDTSES